MNLAQRKESLIQLAGKLHPESPAVQDIAAKAYEHNRWFTPENIFRMLTNISEQFLQEEKLEQWISAYKIREHRHPKTVGLIMAGNIPLVGFHDLLCVMISGHKALVKLSSKDNILLPWLLERLYEADDYWRSAMVISDLLTGMDAAIATGSNNSSRYFNYYLSKYPHIIRKNRGSVAVITGLETSASLQQLGIDIFSYFGLGCRNVSKLLVPAEYSFDRLFESLEPFRSVIDHHKYKNNFDYNLTLLLMNRQPHFHNDFIILREDARIVSPVATLHYERYADEAALREKLLQEEAAIQCIAGEGYVGFGKTQAPELWDYADHIDTLQFLNEL